MDIANIGSVSVILIIEEYQVVGEMAKSTTVYT